MPFAFSLPTTGSVALIDFYASDTHPSLPLIATTKRSVVKDALKKFKRLAPRDQAASLPAIQNALNEYIPYLLAIHTAAGFGDVGKESVELRATRPLQTEWRSTLSTALPGREPIRARVGGSNSEIAFVLTTLAYVHTLLARSAVRGLYDTTQAMSSEQRTTAVSAAMKHLLDAHALHKYLVTTAPIATGGADAPVDIQPTTISGLAALALAEANLVVVAKDDPYVAAVADDRNTENKDWMYKAPTIPKVRAHLYARICLAAAEHAAQSAALLAQSVNKLGNELIKYVTDVRMTARGKAARFLAIDAELSGKTGEGLAWLKGARKEMGLSVEFADGKRKGFRGLKQSWNERREDRRVEKSTDWGLDGGRLEEARVVEMLETKWEKENSTINVQVVPPFEPLLAAMPSGRDYHSTIAPYEPPVLDASTLAQMRAPLGPDDQVFRGNEADSGDEDDAYSKDPAQPPGAFPDSAAVPRSHTSNTYY